MTDTTTETAREYRWGTGPDSTTLSPSDLPATSIFALVQRGLNHISGNEVASQVAAWKKGEEGSAATDAQIEAYAKTKRDEKLEKIMDGSLGVRAASAPRTTGIASVMHAIAVERLRAKLKKFDLVLPTGDKTISVAGKDMDRGALIAAELRHGDAAIRAEAERRMAVEAGSAEALENLFAE